MAVLFSKTIYPAPNIVLICVERERGKREIQQRERDRKIKRNEIMK